MREDTRSKAQLLAELDELRAKNGALERREAERKRSEKEVSVDEERYRDLVNQLPDTVWQLNREGVVTFISPSVKSMSGYDAKELVGLSFDRMVTDFVIEESAEEARQILKQRLGGKLGEEDIIFELEFRRKEGGQFIGEIRLGPLLSSNGEMNGVQGTLRDITERKRAEEALRKSEKQFREFAEHVHEAIWIYDLAGQRLTYMNSAFEKIWGCPREDAFKNPGVYIETVCPEFLDEVSASMERQLGGESAEIEYQIVRPDGSLCWIRDRSFPIKDGTGKVLRLVGIAEDITERKEAEAALKESGERYLTMMEDAPVGLNIVNMQGVVTYVNKRFEKVSGYSREEVLGKNGFDLGMFSDHTLKYFVEGMEAIKKEGQTEPFETRFRRKDGTWIWVELQARLLTEGGKMTGFQIASRDITGSKHAEEALKESEAKHRSILEDMEEGYFEVDLAGNLSFFNPAMVEILGYSPEEMLGMNNRKFMDEENSANVFERFNEVFRTGKSARSLEYVLLRKDGSPRYFETSIILRKDSAGKAIGFQGVGRDITERKLAEQTLRESEERFRTIFQSAPDAVFLMVVEGEDAGRIVAANERAERMHGYLPGELTGKRIMELDAPDAARVAPDRLRRLASGERLNFEIEHRRKDGTSFPVEVTATRIVLNGIEHVLAFDRDITDRKLTEEALQKSEEHYREFVEGTNDLITRVDANGRFTYLNHVAEKVFGVRTDQCLGRSASDFIHTDDRERTEKWLSDCVSRGVRQASLENRHVSETSGEISHFLWTTNFLYDERGEVAGINSIGHDITELRQGEEERRRLEARMEQTQKLESLGVLAGGIAHDFNNILHTILGNADLALKEIAPEGPGRRRLGEIRIAVRRAAELTDQMLTYSGSRPLALQKLDLGDLVQEMAHLLEASQLKKARVNYHFEENLPAVEADPSQMRQVVMNLIINASEAIGDETGAIAVRTGVSVNTHANVGSPNLSDGPTTGRFVYLEVSDTGCGMDEETRNRIFEPFFTTKFTGRGLGMAAVSGIVRAHGGTIDISSEAGQGTTIKVLFPALDESVRPASSHSLEDDDWSGHGTILVVDDDSDVLKLQRLSLERTGFLVLAAADGQEAVEVFRDHMDEVVCVFLDLTMPHMGGEETYTAIRSLSQDVPVVLLSGYGEKEVKERCADLGFAGFLKKPCERRDMIKMLREVLESKGNAC